MNNKVYIFQLSKRNQKMKITKHMKNLKSYNHEYYLKHKDDIIKQTTAWRLKNTKRYNELIKIWRKNNPEKIWQLKFNQKLKKPITERQIEITCLTLKRLEIMLEKLSTLDNQT